MLTLICCTEFNSLVIARAVYSRRIFQIFSHISFSYIKLTMERNLVHA